MSPRHEPGRLRSGYALPPSAWLNHHPGGQEFCRQGGSIHLSLDSVVATDGNVYMGRERGSLHNASGARLQIRQKEPELLDKVAKLMGSDTPLTFQQERGIRGATYSFETSDSQVIRDLIGLGITARKSRTLQFPSMPAGFLRHFIRGCWDGDGTVYFDGRGQGCAAFGSGSRAFVDSMLGRLVELGLPAGKVYEESRSSGYWYFRFHGGQCERLFHVLYDDTDESIRLSRKYELFRAIASK